MARKRNPVGIAAGKLILAIEHECSGAIEEDDASVGRKVIYRARTLLQASQSSSVTSLLDGRTVVEYLDAAWVERHPSIRAEIVAFVAVLDANKN